MVEKRKGGGEISQAMGNRTPLRGDFRYSQSSKGGGRIEGLEKVGGGAGRKVLILVEEQKILQELKNCKQGRNTTGKGGGGAIKKLK